MSSGETWEVRMTAARERRIVRWNARITWLGANVARLVAMTMVARVRLACQLLRDRIVINLSIPVRKIVRRIKRRDRETGRVSYVTRTVVDPNSRSKPGEFPRADTTRLMKDVFYEVDINPSQPRGVVGTTLDYGLILETMLDRSFLVRTLNEERANIVGIMTANMDHLNS